jgi:hypothetical protein
MAGMRGSNKSCSGTYGRYVLAIARSVGQLDKTSRSLCRSSASASDRASALPRDHASRRPAPVGTSAYHGTQAEQDEGDQLDEDLVASWIRQAAALPGWVP